MKFRYVPSVKQSVSIMILVIMGFPCAAQEVDRSAVPTDHAEKLWMCMLDLETSISRRLFVLEDFSTAGSPSLSPDGKTIAFDGVSPGSASSSAHIFTCNMDGSDLKDLGPGAMPSWSPRGSRLAFSKYSPEQGVWLMNADGQNQRLIDQQGWSATWSPNGRMIAYSRSSNAGPDFVIFNLVEDEFRYVLNDISSGYSSFYWNFAWSPDSQRICFKGTGKGQGSHVCSVKVGAKPAIVEHFQKESFPADFTWLNNEGIVTSIWSKSQKCPQLFRIAAAQDSTDGDGESQIPPVEIEGQFQGRRNGEADVSRDGKLLLYVSQPAKK